MKNAKKKAKMSKAERKAWSMFKKHIAPKLEAGLYLCENFTHPYYGKGHQYHPLVEGPEGFYSCTLSEYQNYDPEKMRIFVKAQNQQAAPESR